jgi:hypothetical protein
MSPLRVDMGSSRNIGIGYRIVFINGCCFFYIEWNIKKEGQVTQSKVDKMHENEDLTFILKKVPLIALFNKSIRVLFFFYGWHPFGLVFIDCIVSGK